MKSTTSDRQRRASDLLEALPGARRDARVLSIQCANAHHVAVVYRTEGGPVVESTLGRRSHGHRDRVDTPHGRGGTARSWVDLLDAKTGDDALPASCDCGPWTLSRAEIGAWLADGERRVVLASNA